VEAERVASEGGTNSLKSARCEIYCVK